MCFLGKEASKVQRSLKNSTKDVADIHEERSKLGKDLGVLAFPAVIIDFTPELDNIIAGSCGLSTGQS